MILLGNKVGKTSLFTRIDKDEFSGEYNETMAPSICKLKKTLQDMEKIFELLDASGNERFLNSNKIFYKEADIVLLIYDITDKESLRGVISIYNSLEYCLESKEHTVFVIGNKIDLIDQQEDNEQEGREFAELINAFYVSISCSTGAGIKEIFEHIIIDKNKVDYTGIKLSESSRQPKTKCC